MSDFVIGCTHFEDPTIIQFRPQFTSLEDMHEKIKKSWNSRVTDKDTVYILGDFALAKIDYWAHELTGQKILIQGNHDKHAVHGGCFTIVEQSLLLRLPSYGELDRPQEIFLFHFPCLSWEGRSEGAVHLHAHSHGNLPTSLPGKPGPERLDMSVDCWDSWPVPLEKAVEVAKNKPSGESRIQNQKETASWLQPFPAKSTSSSCMARTPST